MKRILLSLCFATSLAVASEGTLKLPSFSSSIIEAQFPVFKGDNKSLADLRRHRQQLEYFREQSLEGYNRALRKHVSDLSRFDKKLEIDRAAGRITSEQYEALHQAILSEIEKSGPSGEYIEVYLAHLAKYKKERDWLLPEIAALERERVKF